VIRLFILDVRILFRNHVESQRHLHSRKKKIGTGGEEGMSCHGNLNCLTNLNFTIACVNFNNLLNVAICFVVSPRLFFFVCFTRTKNFSSAGKSNSRIQLLYRYGNVCLRLVINSPNLIENCLLSLPPIFFTVIHALKVAVGTLNSIKSFLCRLRV
jgi:hypothetical protein